MNKIINLVLVLIIAAAAFFGGMKYQQSQQPTRPDFEAMRGSRQGSSRMNQEGMETVRGEIISQDETSMVVKSADESTKIVLISENTEINKATQGSIEDLKPGEPVMVLGKQNADGSLSANQIQLNFGPQRNE